MRIDWLHLSLGDHSLFMVLSILIKSSVISFKSISAHPCRSQDFNCTTITTRSNQILYRNIYVNVPDFTSVEFKISFVSIYLKMCIYNNMFVHLYVHVHQWCNR